MRVSSPIFYPTHSQCDPATLQLLSNHDDLDQEVLKLDEDAARRKLVLGIVSEWSVLPTFAKVLLLVATFFMILCSYMVTCLQCFMPYQVSDTIECELNGDALNIITPKGWVAMVFFTLSLVIWYFFSMWEGKQVKKYIEENGLPKLKESKGEQKLSKKTDNEAEI